MISLKDANDKWVCIDETDLIECLAESKFTILGMDFQTISALKREYDIRSTKQPMTPESVKEAFSKGE